MTAYGLRISDWSSDGCSSDPEAGHQQEVGFAGAGRLDDVEPCHKGAASGAAERQAVQRSQASSRAEFRRRGSEKAARHLAGGDEVRVERRRDAEAGKVGRGSWMGSGCRDGEIEGGSGTVKKTNKY